MTRLPDSIAHNVTEWTRKNLEHTDGFLAEGDASVRAALATVSAP